MDTIDPRLAKVFADRAERLADFGNEQFMSASNWLMASNFAINAGALVAAFPLAKESGAAKIALCLFGVGILSAMLNAFVIQQLHAARHEPSEERLKLMRRAEIDGEIDTPAIAEVEERINAIYRRSWLPPLFGWISALTFLIGGAVLAWSL